MTIPTPATFTISVHIDGTLQATEAFPSPGRIPQAGDVYRVRQGFRTRAGCAGRTGVYAEEDRNYYIPGDELQIIERTQEAPHGRLNSLGNLRVRCKYRESIWTNIELALNEGLLVLARTAQQPLTAADAAAQQKAA